MRVAIIGTAGGGADANRLTRDLYRLMYKDTLRRLRAWSTDPPREVDLVSGGAAWSDHLAVSLWLDGQARSLVLCLPAPFVAGRFQDTPAGRRTNQLHRAFSAVMGASTLEGIQRALERGAAASTVTTCAPGHKPSASFLARNLLVGRCDAVLAYSWGARTDFPGDRGTIHTWTHATAPADKKVHVRIQDLA
jgi:hypothetical protein